ncbi:MAG TPA: DUF5916 domain-containing protein [Longimicrobiales bacterium]|nr:DUF5916 domain-containing protein [Longimicrobiales bacterium]
MKAHTLSVTALATLLSVNPLVAQSHPGNGSAVHYPADPTALPRPTLAAQRIEVPIRIDGHLDEAIWLHADSTTTDFIQVQPNPGYPASHATVVRILYDEKTLYIGATLYEDEPDRLIVPGLEQDFSTHDSDILGIAIDTYHDKQNGFLFALNPAGALWDAQTFNDGRDVALAWEGIVDVRTSVGPDRWTVEMAVPFATLRYNPTQGEQVWGIAFSRRIRHLNEESNWAPTERQHKLYKFSLAGTLTGLRDLGKGRNLWVKPYVLGSRSTLHGTPEAANHADGGLDAKWGVTPRMTLDLTVNTDFSQVEVDQEQVNLDRFSLFFPEKRDFFLENEGTFAFQDVVMRNYRAGSSPQKFKLFHSRRIGLSSDRTPLPIAGGARLTGKVGDRTEVGLLEMQTRTDGITGDPSRFLAENFAVARVKTLVGDASNLGVMFVNRQQTAGVGQRDYNRSVGVDGNVTLFDDLVLSAYGAHTDEMSPSGDSRYAAMFQAAYRNPLWDVSLLAKHIGDDFNPGLGFVDRVGVRRLYATLGLHPQVASNRVFELNPYVETDLYTNLSGSLESRTVTGALAVAFTDGDMLTVAASDRHEQLFATTPIAGRPMPQGVYQWREAQATYMVAGSKRLSGIFAVSGGDFYDGSRLTFFASARFRPSPHLTADLGINRNNLTLNGADFTADVYSARVRWGKDVRTFLMGFVQYNQTTEELISNVRFNLIHAPLSDLFLVFTERRSLADGVAESVLERGLTLKVTKLLAF